MMKTTATFRSQPRGSSAIPKPFPTNPGGDRALFAPAARPLRPTLSIQPSSRPQPRSAHARGSRRAVHRPASQGRVRGGGGGGGALEWGVRGGQVTHVKWSPHRDERRVYICWRYTEWGGGWPCPELSDPRWPHRQKKTQKEMNPHS
eukprot:gene5948-biopygen5808